MSYTKIQMVVQCAKESVGSTADGYGVDHTVGRNGSYSGHTVTIGEQQMAYGGAKGWSSNVLEQEWELVI